MKKRPADWCRETGIDVVDPDGWRDDGKDWEEAIDEDEFLRRVAQCTIRIRPKVLWP